MNGAFSSNSPSGRVAQQALALAQQALAVPGLRSVWPLSNLISAHHRFGTAPKSKPTNSMRANRLYGYPFYVFNPITITKVQIRKDADAGGHTFSVVFVNHGNNKATFLTPTGSQLTVIANNVVTLAPAITYNLPLSVTLTPGNNYGLYFVQSGEKPNMAVETITAMVGVENYGHGNLTGAHCAYPYYQDLPNTAIPASLNLLTGAIGGGFQEQNALPHFLLQLA